MTSWHPHGQLFEGLAVQIALSSYKQHFHDHVNSRSLPQAKIKAEGVRQLQYDTHQISERSLTMDMHILVKHVPSHISELEVTLWSVQAQQKLNVWETCC